MSPSPAPTTDQQRLRSAALEELLCFDLYATSRAVTAAYRPLLDRLGLTYPQFLVLVVLAPGTTHTIGDVARELRLDHGTLTPLLRRLETAGLLTRSRSAADERVVELALTERGATVRAEFDDVRCRIGAVIGLDDERRRQLQQTLRRLADDLAENTAGGPPTDPAPGSADR